MPSRTDSTGVNLGLFVKEPRPGRVKTRLAVDLGATTAAELYRAFVADTLTLASNSGARHCRIFHEGAPVSTWDPAALPAGCSEVSQAGHGLGERLGNAFVAGPCPMLVLGTDSPDLPAAHLRSAMQALRTGAQLVLGAVADGGVWCIGLDRARPGLFVDIPWSTAEAGEALRNRADQLGLNRAEIEPWYDCDDEADLRSLAERLRSRAGGATMTRRFLARFRPEPG